MVWPPAYQKSPGKADGDYQNKIIALEPARDITYAADATNTSIGRMLAMPMFNKHKRPGWISLIICNLNF